MQDIKSVTALWVKAVLFLVIALGCAVMLWLEFRTLRAAVLILLLVWASARAYYFAFYVIHHYADSSFRYAGIWSLLAYILRRRRRTAVGTDLNSGGPKSR